MSKLFLICKFYWLDRKILHLWYSYLQRNSYLYFLLYNWYHICEVNWLLLLLFTRQTDLNVKQNKAHSSIFSFISSLSTEADGLSSPLGVLNIHMCGSKWLEQDNKFCELTEEGLSGGVQSCVILIQLSYSRPNTDRIKARWLGVFGKSGYEWFQNSWCFVKHFYYIANYIYSS